mmetsp:Transcript_90599/g.251938  ORF Transcript_90599/g.251938 Transcript_90599/m.251938 type:complete len:507 (-) Transcript_90599:91-1611(-)
MFSWLFFFIATGGLLFGYIIGINSDVVTQGQLLCVDGHHGPAGSWSSWGYNQCYELSSIAMGLLSSLNLIGACISSLACFRYADALGRKLEVQIGGALYLAGALVAGLSPVLWGVFAGFLVYGLGIGFAMHVAPVYIAEISPAAIRGTLVSAKEAIIVLGIFLGFLAGYIFSGLSPFGWRFMTLLASVPALLMLCGAAGLPQSPRFLVLQAARRGDLESTESAEYKEASAALQFFRQASATAVQPELASLAEELRASLQEDREKESLLHSPGGPRQQGFFDAFGYPGPLLVGCGVVLLQQVTGQPSVLYYATNIFKSAGFGSTAALQSVFVGLVKLLATLFTVWQVDRFGRRPLLLGGIGMMVVALALLAASFLHTSCSAPGTSIAACSEADIRLPHGWAAVTVAALMLYVTGYQVGFGPIAWLLISEIFPLKVRGSALSVAAMVNFGSNLALTLYTALLMELLTPSGLFLAFLVLGGASLVFVWALVPETKGKSLEEIEAIMAPH